jgi:hypothetical protein
VGESVRLDNGDEENDASSALDAERAVIEGDDGDDDASDDDEADGDEKEWAGGKGSCCGANTSENSFNPNWPARPQPQT